VLLGALQLVILILPFAKMFGKEEHKEQMSQMMLRLPFSGSALGPCAGTAQPCFLPEVGAERHLVLLRFFIMVFFCCFKRLLHMALYQKHELSCAYASLPGSQTKSGALCSIHFTQPSPTRAGAVHVNDDKLWPPSRMIASYNCPRKNISSQA